MSLASGTATHVLKVRSAAAQQRTRETPENTDDRHWRIYKTIRERISLLRYPPGTVLGESELANEFQVSRTPIRRVLQRLEYEGMVAIRNGVGTIVTDVDLKTIKEIYDLRMHLAEMMGALSAPEITASQTRSMATLLARAKALNKKKQRDFEGYARLCNDLEEVLLSLIGSAPLREITDMFYYRVSRIWFTYLPKLDWNDVTANLQSEIAVILDAMKRGDLRGVGQTRRLHLYGILSQISEHVAHESGAKLANGTGSNR